MFYFFLCCFRCASTHRHEICNSAWESEHERQLSEQLKRSAGRKIEMQEAGKAAVDKFYAERKALLEQRRSDLR
jgi:hypothetical protein